jgi:nitrile hydratase
MNGPHDLGGQAGFGPVVRAPDEPVFHADWERRALALQLAVSALGRWTIDASRHAREALHPADYYASSYYAMRTMALERQLIDHGLVTAAELVAGSALAPAAGAAPPTATEMRTALARGAPYARDPQGRPPAYAAGDRVRTLVMHPPGHTRLPRYARGKAGVVEAVQGFHVFPDANAHGGGEAPQWLYTVVFEAAELWGRDADPNQRLSIDAWESYLEPA